MDCIAVIAVSAGVIFARLAMIQELNPFLWGFLALTVYAGVPYLMLHRGADWASIWASSFVGLFVLFIVQSVVAARQRYRGRGGPGVAKGSTAKSKQKGKGKAKGR
jgi:hypothetical protein